MAKIEVIKQQDISDCGACSLFCIIKYYQGYVPIEKIREDTCTTKTGTTAYHLVHAAKNYGFDAMGVKVDDIFDEKIYYPVIGHVVLENGLNHFVVVYKVTKKDVWLMDPAYGKVKMKMNDFLAIWDHFLILLTPITQIMKYDQNLTISSIFYKLILKNKTIFIQICLINFLLMIFTIVSSFYFQYAITFIERGKEFSFFKIIFLMFLWISLFKVIFTFVKHYYLSYFYKNIDVVLFSDFLSHIFHLPLKFMQNRSTGEVVSRVQDLMEVKDFLAEAFTNVLLNSVLVVGSLIVLYYLSYPLFFILCLVVIVYVSIGILSSKLIDQRIKENIQTVTDFHSVLVENISINTSIHNLDLIDSFFKRLENKMIRMFKSNFQTEQFLNFLLLFKEAIYEIGLFLVIAFGISFIYLGKLELASFMTFYSLVLTLFHPIQNFIYLIPKYLYLKATFQKLTEFINIRVEENQKGLMKVSNTNIEFLDVSYSYNQVEAILEHVNFKIRMGEKVLFIGPSGSGKSTICNSLITLCNVKNGIIKLGGENLADYSLGTIHRTILYVGQNEKLFSGSILENIICFRDVAESDYLAVIRICHLEEMVQHRPNRYHTLINASINNLSGGERQRIILARALLKKAKILILDEALSEVDLALEKEIIASIQEYFADLTLLYVSHKDVQNQFQKVIDVGEFHG